MVNVINTNTIQVLNNQTTSASSSTVLLAFRGNRAEVQVGGTFDGASVTFFTVDNAGNAIPVKDLTLTTITVIAATSFPITFPYNQGFYATVSSAGAATSIDVNIQEIKSGR